MPLEAKYSFANHLRHFPREAIDFVEPAILILNFHDLLLQAPLPDALDPPEPLLPAFQLPPATLRHKLLQIVHNYVEVTYFLVGCESAHN